MAYDVLHIDDLTDALVAYFSNLLPTKNVSRNSDNWKRLRALAAGIADLHAHIDAVYRDALPDTAKGDALDRWGALLELPRKGATPASAENAGKIRGTNGSTWSTSNTLVHKSGRTYRPTTSGTMGASGEALVGIVAISTGSSTRLAAGEVLTWSSTPSGLESEVELQLALSSGGDDAEPDGPYRTRVLARMAQPAAGGNVSDWRNWALESSDAIAEAYVYPNRSGVGSVDVAALKAGSGTTRLLDATERSALLTALDAERPVSAAARVIEVVTETLDVEVAILPESAVRFTRDWDDSTPPVVSTWNATTRVLTFSGSRPASIAVGDRLVVDGTSGEELIVESLSSSNGVVLVDAKSQTPVATALVYSGGPVIAPARQALLDLINNLGPRTGAFGAGYWEGTFRLGKAFEAVQTAEGVLDSTWITPTANVEPTPEAYPDDATVGLLVPGSIIVRYQ